ncbi:MAG: threonylcarbamoyl-AMP synthase, partial [Clostridia bacterium]|nr:threonylcarbamoyl-AMP synthase [Clostridia bacterium]
MKTQVFTINDPSEAAEQLKAAGRIIRDGGLVVFPTETVYGLGGDGTNPNAAAGIYAAKGRPSDNPLIIHIADPEDADAYAHTCPLYFALAKAFMPGPLTVIMPKRDSVPLSVTGGLDSVAVRCPSHPVANALIRAAGTCIAAPSANTSGKPSPTEASHVLQDLDGKVDVIIDGGECEIGLESTIVKILQ